MNSIQPKATLTAAAPGGGKAIQVGLALIAVSALALNIYLVSRVSHVEREGESRRAGLESELQSLYERLAAQQGAHDQKLAALRAAVEQSSRTSYSQAYNEAQRRAAGVSKELTAKQREQQEMFLTEISAVREAASAGVNGLKKVEGDVEGVASQVDQTRRELAQAEDLLLSTQDQLAGVHGRVELHAEDLARLRGSLERSVTHFTLDQSKDRTRVDDIQVRLKVADSRKNRYTVEILADDQIIVKKNSNANEPIEFYVTGADRPYELVVTDIQKGRVSGYLSKPKLTALARR